MKLKDLRIGVALTGSFCTFSRVLPELEKIVTEGAEIFPIISEAVAAFDTRFGTSDEWKRKIEAICGKEIIKSIVEAEPIGPKGLLDILAVAPCTGNTLGKLANGITDTTVTMACKAHLRNGRPLLLAPATNDGLGVNAKNLGLLYNAKNIYFVPFGQDDPMKKCNSLVADFELLIPAIESALKGNQLQPMLK
ncbi:MAG: dipicolinate synthase subunit B [Clostridiaceae bacterium]|jgi:dipicolinate synthase subunit B|nr:dipicolinate synthase subunit B [Clostridiaceae bacterium]